MPIAASLDRDRGHAAILERACRARRIQIRTNCSRRCARTLRRRPCSATSTARSRRSSTTRAPRRSCPRVGTRSRALAGRYAAGRLRLRPPGRRGAADRRARRARPTRQPRLRAPRPRRAGAARRRAALAGHEDDAAAFLGAVSPDRLAAAGLRIEDKGPIRALHWRGAEDEARAEAEAEAIAAEAEAAGLALHRGRKVHRAAAPGPVRQGDARSPSC